MPKEKFSSRESVVLMAQHYETLLVATRMMKSDHPFVADAMTEMARVKKQSGNRCFLTTTMMDELFRRNLLNEEDFDMEEDEDA